jgi:hypothetical protein
MHNDFNGVSQLEEIEFYETMTDHQRRANFYADA